MAGGVADPRRWQRLKPLLEHALDLDHSERAAFIAGLNGEDAELRADLERLLTNSIGTEGARDPLAAALASVAMSAAMSDPEDPVDPRIHAVLGHYRILRVLGAGGMGTVYVAERNDGEFSQQVALKVVEGGGVNSAARARFERERQILASLRHPGIALLFDGGETPDGLPYYTMELVEGNNAFDYCRAQLHTIEQRVRLLVEVAAALAYAHQHLVVHRDIKPSNILVTTDGHVKLLDFGIAKPMGDAAAMTHSEIGPMTREYAAPEQFRGGAITVATDIFQFGTLCYRLLSGHLPYRADPGDTYAWAHAVTDEEPISLSRAITLTGSGKGWSENASIPRLRNRLRGDLDAIVRKALAKAPEQRYRSMDAMIADFEAYLAGRPITARRAGAMYFAWRWMARRPLVSAGALLAVVALIAVALYASFQARIARAEAARANSEAERATSVNNFLIELFKVSDPGVNRGERLNANQILERGAERVEREFSRQPAQRAQLQIVIGHVYQQLGDLPNADPFLLADALRIHAYGIAVTSGDPRAGLKLLDEAQAVLAQPATADQSNEKALVHVAAANMQILRGDFQAARAQIASARELGLQTGFIDSAEGSIIFILSGDLDEETGHLAGSAENFRQAYRIRRQELGEAHPDTLVAAENLARATGNLGDYAAARTQLLDVAQSQRRLRGESNYGYASIVLDLAQVELQRRAFDSALEQLAKADAIFSALPSDQKKNRGLIRTLRGAVFLQTRLFTSALGELEQALELQRSALPEDHPDIATSLMFKSEALVRLGRVNEAVVAADAALGTFRAKFGADHRQTIRALYRVGLARDAAGDKATARSALSEARAHGPQAFAVATHPEWLELQRAIDAVAAR